MSASPSDVTWPIRNPDHLLRDQRERACDYCGRLYHPWRTAKPARCCSSECFGKLLSRRAWERRAPAVLGPLGPVRAAQIAEEMRAALTKGRLATTTKEEKP